MTHRNGNQNGDRGPLYYGEDLIARGYPVLPLSPKGKHPSVEGGIYDATLDPQVLGEWIMDGRHDHNIGIATGSFCRVVVIDADTPEQRERMESSYGPPHVETKRGGHWYFKHPGGGKIKSKKIEAGLDCKGDWGYVVAPPSPGKSWTNGIPERAKLPPMPPDFIAKTRQGSKDSSWVGDGEPLDKFKIQEASVVIARHAARLEQGDRHEHLLPLCRVLLDRGVSLDDAEAIVVGAWNIVGGELAERASREVPNAVRTTRDRISDGDESSGVPTMERITPGLFAELQRVLGWETGEDGVRGDSEDPGGAGSRTREKDKLTESELYAEWARANDDIKVSGGEARRYARGVWPVIEEGAIGLELWETIDRFGATNTSVRTVRSALDRIKSRGHKDEKSWDRDPFLLVVKNGTLEFGGETPVLREHRREDYVRYGLPIEYDDNEEIDLWRRVLDRLDPDVQLLLQQFVGYALTSDVSEAKTVWLHGEPGGGKSTFIDTVAKLFGERAGHFSLDDLSSPFGLASIPGRTLLTSTEQPRAYIPQSHTLSSIISGEKITVNQKNVKAYEYRSTAKILWAMNNLPTVQGSSSGLFRRVLPIAWPGLAPDERDKNLFGNLDKELPAILNWALDGLRSYREAGGLIVPQSILDAQEAFKAESDPVLQFVEEEMVEGDPETIYHTTAALYTEYSRWCDESGHKRKARLGFTQDLATKRDWEVKQVRRDGVRDYYLLGGTLRKMAGRD